VSLTALRQDVIAVRSYKRKKVSNH